MTHIELSVPDRSPTTDPVTPTEALTNQMRTPTHTFPHRHPECDAHRRCVARGVPRAEARRPLHVPRVQPCSEPGSQQVCVRVGVCVCVCVCVCVGWNQALFECLLLGVSVPISARSGEGWWLGSFLFRLLLLMICFLGKQRAGGVGGGGGVTPIFAKGEPSGV